MAAHSCVVVEVTISTRHSWLSAATASFTGVATSNANNVHEQLTSLCASSSTRQVMRACERSKNKNYFYRAEIIMRLVSCYQFLSCKYKASKLQISFIYLFFDKYDFEIL